MLTMVRRAPIPFFACLGLLLGILFRTLLGWNLAAGWTWNAVLLLGGAPIVYKTLQKIFQCRFASDIVAMLAILTALFLHQAFAGAVIVLMQSGGEAIEAYGLNRATSSLAALLKRAPRRAWRKRGQEMEEIDVQEVQIGDLLIVRPGDLVPVDGTILTGFADIDESALTGEPLSRSFSQGDRILSGSVDLNGVIEMRADQTSRESQYAKIVEQVQLAHEKKAPIQRLADRYAIFFTPLTLLVCAIGYVLTRDPATILSVLVVATPCPLILAVPLAVICSINRAADEGIIVKGGAPIEQIASVQVALFDKTGTITFGTPVVEEVIALADESPEDVLRHAALINQFSSHSVAKAIVNKSLEKFQNLPLPKRFQEFPGRGVEGEIDGAIYYVGSDIFIEQKTAKNHREHYHEIAQTYCQKNKLLVYVAKGPHYIGILVLTDRIRPEAPAMLRQLRTLGVQHIAMLTGDGKKNAEVIAKQAGIDIFQAQLLPEQKRDAVQSYMKQYRSVMMVGDGINDAPALATATVGVAMGAYGTAISAEAADIVLLVDDLMKVAKIVAIGQRMLHVAKQSIWIGIGLSSLLMGIAACGHILPAAGALLQEVIDIAVILNALRAR